jgi:hypothetical protein
MASQMRALPRLGGLLARAAQDLPQGAQGFAPLTRGLQTTTDADVSAVLPARARFLERKPSRMPRSAS